MKYFVTLDEDLLLKLWMLDPQLVAPFSRQDRPVQTQVNQVQEPSECQLKVGYLPVDDARKKTTNT